jgi:hypothetical protein
MRVIPWSLQDRWERKAELYLFNNYRRKYYLVQCSVNRDISTDIIAKVYAGRDFILGIIIILAANSMYNAKHKPFTQRILTYDQ